MRIRLSLSICWGFVSPMKIKSRREKTVFTKNAFNVNRVKRDSIEDYCFIYLLLAWSNALMKQYDSFSNHCCLNFFFILGNANWLFFLYIMKIFCNEKKNKQLVIFMLNSYPHLMYSKSNLSWKNIYKMEVHFLLFISHLLVRGASPGNPIFHSS